VTEAVENFATFARDVKEGITIASTSRDAIRMHRLIDAAIASGESRRRLPFDATLTALG
jgi:predicted dehydrogenase